VVPGVGQSGNSQLLPRSSTVLLALDMSSRHLLRPVVAPEANPSIMAVSDTFGPSVFTYGSRVLSLGSNRLAFELMLRKLPMVQEPYMHYAKATGPRKPQERR
jgi:hypothetical protein